MQHAGQPVNATFLSGARARLYGFALFAIGLPLFPATYAYVTTRRDAGSDWGDFWTAGSTVGTRALLDPAAHAAWGQAHGLSASAFVYVPAAAWLFKPAASFSLGSSFVANAVIMLAICIFAGLVAAKTYHLDQQLAVVGVLAWAPATAAMVTGQNSPFGLLLTLLAIYGLTRERNVLAGVAIGLLCYKPTYAVPLIMVLLVFRRWRELAVVCASCGAWYLASVVATAFDWGWPLRYIHVVGTYVGPDFIGNASKVISMPGTLLRCGVEPQLAFATGAVLLAGSAFVYFRVSMFEAASLSGLIGLAASPHAWEYDAILVLPSIFYVVRNLREPWRTRVIGAAYILAPLWQFSVVFLRFDPIAIIVICGSLGWCVLRLASPVPSRIALAVDLDA